MSFVYLFLIYPKTEVGILRDFSFSRRFVYDSQGNKKANKQKTQKKQGQWVIYAKFL